MRSKHLALCVLLLPLGLPAKGHANDQPTSTPVLIAETRAGSAGTHNGAPGKDGRPAGTEVIELDWEALIPAEWRMDKLLEGYNADDLSDDDPRAQELLNKLEQLWSESPVVTDFDGKTVKLPGFVVPLEMDAKRIREFLLVPYYGACIHVPPPPSNQTVYVVTSEDHAYEGELFDTVWVTGTIRVEKLSSELGDSGYRIDASKVEPYQ